jgi:hypothetical protein
METLVVEADAGVAPRLGRGKVRKGELDGDILVDWSRVPCLEEAHARGPEDNAERAGGGEGIWGGGDVVSCPGRRVCLRPRRRLPMRI